MKVIKILALRSNPTNTVALRLDEEIRGIKDELERSQYRDRFEFVTEGAVRADDLSRALLKYKPDIVHFSGHGAGEHGLALEDDAGNMQLVSTEALSRLFKWGRSTIKCVLLNACYSKVQAAAIHQNIDCVIGMNKAIGDRAAIKFAAKFYQALVDGESFQSAYDYACTALDLSGSNESSTPELLNRNEGADPLAIITATQTQTQASQGTEPPPPPRAQQSQSIGNISISGSNNPFNAIQAGGNVHLSQTSTQTSSSNSNSDLQAALTALDQLKQSIMAAAELDETEKEMVAVPIKKLEAELQKPQPDQSIVDRAVAALKKGLDGVLTLAEPVAKVAALIAKAWVG